MGDLKMLATSSTDKINEGNDQTLRGIDRVGFQINIERTNICMTGYLSFNFVAVVIITAASLLRLVLPLLAKETNSVKLVCTACATTE